MNKKKKKQTTKKYLECYIFFIKLARRENRKESAIGYGANKSGRVCV